MTDTANRHKRHDTDFPTFLALFGPWYTTRTQSRALLRLIAVATEENLPLAALLESWAVNERGIQRRRLFRLVDRLAEGKPLAEAIEAVPNVLRDEDLLAIRFDAKLGLRTAAIRDLVNRERANDRANARNVTLYIGVILPCILVLGTFIQIKIVPQLNRILADFALELPNFVKFWQELSENLLGYLPIAGVLLLVMLWLAFATQWGRSIRRVLFSRLFTPGKGWISADVLRKLALAATGGRPIAGVLSTLARYHFDPRIRQKLLFVRNEVEQGADTLQSLLAVDLIAIPELRVLEIADRIGNRPWALNQLADVRVARAERRAKRRSTLFLPVMVVGLGLLVLTQALTIFAPLTELLQTLRG